jgi:hypothetical protein
VEADTMTAAELRNAMADRLRAWGGGVFPDPVDAAMRAVPREAFLPGTPLTDAYDRSPVVTHRDVHGVATSSASAPGIVAAMLAQLDVRPGHRILEIGAGTGYNAALLACLTGAAGQVTTVELDPVGGVPERNISLGDTGITIRVDDGQEADATALQQALGSGPVQTWTGIEVTATGELDFWLAGTHGIFRLLAGPEAVRRSGLVPPAFNWGAIGLLTSDSFAYLTRRPGRPGHRELGACAYGPGRDQLAAAYADRIRAFDHDRASAGSLRVEVHPATHPPVPDTLMKIDKRHTRVIVRTGLA